MCTLYYSANSHRKIVHLCHCKILQRIPKENRRSFDSFEEAHAKGYRLCKCCPPVAQRYRKERSAIISFCREQGFTYKLQDGVLHIISRHDCWRIIASGKAKKLFLYHKNTEQRHGNEIHPSIIPGFHSQRHREDTILGYLEYIESHDRCRDKHPCTEKTSSLQESSYVNQEAADAQNGGNDYKDYYTLPSTNYTRIKGTKKYRKAQKQKKRQARRASIIRVYALIDELAEIGC